MKTLLNKERKLAASPLTRFFVLFSLMTLIPGYPILLGSIFVCLGIAYSFLSARDGRDILYTLLLPVSKADAVREKYLFTALFEAVSLALMGALTALRMTVLRSWQPYVDNPLMPANPAYLGWALLIFAVFNLLFVGGFFRTARKLAGPLALFLLAALALTAAGEIACHHPRLAFLAAGGVKNTLFQGAFALAAAAVCVAATFGSLELSVRRFEKLDILP